MLNFNDWLSKEKTLKKLYSFPNVRILSGQVRL